MDLLERDEAVASFAHALRDAAAGRGRVLLVRGEPGIGKTALVRHVLATQAEGARVLVAGCDDLATARPLGPFRDLAGQVDEPLASLLRAAPSVDDLFEPLVDELQRPPRPVVLAIDDVHWADEASLDLLAFLLRRLDRLPALLVLTFRDGLEPTHPLRLVLGRIHAPPAVHLDLPPLSPSAVSTLVGDDDPEALWRRTGGNPFLVTALVRHGGDTVPPTVQDAVLAQLAALDAPERALVELAAVVPRSVETAVLDACQPGWEEHGSRPEQRGLLEFRDGAVAFRHELARQAVAEALPAARRRRLHREVLAVLRDLADDPARLVHHAVGADDVTTLLVAGPAAADAAARAGAHRQALQHYERLVRHEDRLDVADRARLWDRYGSELMTADDPTTSRHAWDRALVLYREAGVVEGQARAMNFLSGLAWIQHEPEVSDRYADAAIRLLEEHGVAGHELAQAYARNSGHAMTRWDFDTAIDWAERALAVAEPAGLDVAAANATNMIGTCLVTRGDVDDGLEVLDRSIALAGRIGAHNLVSLGLANASEALLDVARPDLVERYLDHGVDVVDRHETTSVGGYLAGVHARLHAVRAEWDDALEAGLPVWDGGPIEAVNQVVAGLALARALIRTGRRTDEMVTMLGEILTIRPELQYRGPAAALRAEAAWLAGHPAPPELADVLADARACGQPWLLGDLAVWAHRHGRLDVPPGELVEVVAEPHARTLAGDPTGASAAWQVRHHPYEAQLALVEIDDVATVRGAVEAVDLLGAAPLAERLRTRLRELGVRRIPRGPQTTTRENPAGLTDRQLEVLRHVAAGRTNAEIAEALVLSVRTVDHHVSATLAKLGVGSRQEAADRAATLGIVPAG
jgi:DNA-binding CsgD family transcriptional regulator/tetratricopeptide (TPR) repeat protein